MTTTQYDVTSESEKNDAETRQRKRSWINWLSLLAMCLASALLCASVMLIHQYKLGIPFTLPVSLAIAATVGILVPLLCARAFVYFKPKVIHGAYYTFLITNLILSIGISLLIF